MRAMRGWGCQSSPGPRPWTAMGTLGKILMAATAGFCGFASGFLALIVWLTVYFGYLPSVEEQKGLSARLEFSMNSNSVCLDNVSSLELNLQDLARQRSSLQNVNSRLVGDVENLKSDLRVKDGSLAVMQRELKRATQELQIHLKQLEKVNSLVESYFKRLSFLERERAVYGSDLESRRSEVERLLQDINDMHFRFANGSDVTEPLRSSEASTTSDRELTPTSEVNGNLREWLTTHSLLKTPLEEPHGDMEMEP